MSEKPENDAEWLRLKSDLICDQLSTAPAWVKLAVTKWWHREYLWAMLNETRCPQRFRVEWKRAEGLHVVHDGTHTSIAMAEHLQEWLTLNENRISDFLKEHGVEDP
ncbi:hypothetical protein [Ruegeria atlantica]|uniref:hypothetical protein n=1 Tax=Ruegeria atlantica TaxID=81569 RepID=UPI00147A2D68|nr:hypothetical protein [Ruegeria atlantica]